MPTVCAEAAHATQIWRHHERAELVGVGASEILHIPELEFQLIQPFKETTRADFGQVITRGDEPHASDRATAEELVGLAQKVARSRTDVLHESARIRVTSVSCPWDHETAHCTKPGRAMRL